MKLKKLYIKNIASIGEATIDFENSSLANEPLFLICGETGSGKSTLLDAVCLALYQKTPRIDAANDDTYNDPKIKNNVARANDPRQLLRRDTAEGIARLDFTGTDGHAYTATWSVARAHGKADGNLQQAKTSVTDHTDGCTVTNRKDIAALIEGPAVGLTFEQFCHTTLLAQGQFAQFLQSKGSEKSVMLEKLTGSEKFARIGATISKITIEKKNEYFNAKAALDSISVLSDETIADKKAQIQALNGQNEKLNTQKANAETRLRWLEKDAELTKRNDDAMANLSSLETKISSKEFKDSELTVSQWNETADQRRMLGEITTYEADLRSLSTKISGMKPDFYDLSGGIAWLKDRKSSDEQRLNAIAAQLKQLGTMQNTLANAAVITDRLCGILSHRNKLVICDKQLLDLTNIQKSLDEKVNALEKRKVALDAQLHEKDSEAKSLQTQIEKADIASIQKQLSAVSSSENELACFNNDFRNFKKLSATAQKCETDSASATTAVNACRDKFNEAQQVLSIAAHGFEERKSIYDKLSNCMKDWAQNARQQLSIGDTCPVCGKVIDSVLHDDSFVSVLTPAREAADKAENEFNAAKSRRDKLQGQLDELMQNETKAQRAAQDAAADLAKAKTLFLAQASKLKISTNSDVAKQISDLGNSLANKKSSLHKQFNDAQQLTDRLNAARAELDALHAELDNHAAELEKCRKDAAEANTSTQMLKQEQENAKAAIAKSKAVVDGFMGTEQPDWNQRFSDDSDGFLKWLGDKANLLKQLTTEHAELTESIRTGTADLSAASSLLRGQSFFASANNSAKRVDNLVEKAKEFMLKLNSCLTQQNHLESELQQRRKLLDDFLSANPQYDHSKLKQLSQLTAQTISAKKADLDKTKSECLAAQKLCKGINAEIQAHRAAKPKFADGDTADSLHREQAQTEALITANNKRIGMLEQELQYNDDVLRQKSDKIEDCKHKNEEWNKWSKLDTMFGKSDGGHFREVAMSFILKSLLRNANAYLAHFTDRYELDCQPGSLSVLLKDRFVGDTHGASSTLSGGERFMASLALALALAQMNGSTAGKTDTLFIDEGFGTLDANSRAHVMDTLEKLRQIEKRRVGIISHIPDLAERIPVQILVKRTGPTCSTVTVTQSH